MIEVRELIRTLQTRPGRGGVRLSYEQADLCLRLITAGAHAIAAAEGRAGHGKPRHGKEARAMTEGPSLLDDGAVVRIRYEPTRKCDVCGSIDLGLVSYPVPGGYWRKECLSCRSTGPFTLVESRKDWRKRTAAIEGHE